MSREMDIRIFHDIQKNTDCYFFRHTALSQKEQNLSKLKLTFLPRNRLSVSAQRSNSAQHKWLGIKTLQDAEKLKPYLHWRCFLRFCHRKRKRHWSLDLAHCQCCNK